ncbi:MAG: 50S ribosomal protein L22 [Deltaproteobacteria bacterium]|nr:50S ribosomal protein L22 [Deltaproteobacteria bacterium]
MAKGATTIELQRAGRARFAYVRMAPRKLEGIVNLVRGRSVGEAVALLAVSVRRGAVPIRKLIQSAVANADQRGGVDVDRLYIHRITVNEGPRMKRSRPRSRGMAHPILKRMSHLAVELIER